MAMSDVWIGATAPEGGAEGETLVVKDGKYDTAYGVVIIDFETDGSDFTSVKTAGEILDLANAGAFLVGRCEAAEDTVYQFNIVGYALSSGTYTMGVMMMDGTISAGTSTDKDDPIVISGS